MGSGASTQRRGGPVRLAKIGEVCQERVTVSGSQATWSAVTADSPGSIISRQCASRGLLHWTLRVTDARRIIIGAVPADFGTGLTEDLACPPTQPQWAVGHGVRGFTDQDGDGVISADEMQNSLAKVTCKQGDRFAVSADMDSQRLLVYQAPEHTEKGSTNSGRWRKVLDTPTLGGIVRLCVTCFLGGSVEVIDLTSEIKSQILEIYAAHNERKTVDVDQLLHEWEGEEAGLLANIQEKYQGDAGEQKRHSGEIRDELEAIYKEHNPNKLGDLDALLEEWKSQEELLLSKVKAKYLGGTDIRSQIIAIYTEHAPRKLKDVDRLLLEWKGEEEILLENIKQKYKQVDIESIRQEIVSLYKQHNQRKLVDVDALLKEWEGEEELLLAEIQKKYPDRRTAQEKRGARLKRLKTVRHLHLVSCGEFGEPPPIEVEESEEEQKKHTDELLQALRPGPNQRTDAQVTVLVKWAQNIAFFQDNVHNHHLLKECCKNLDCVSLSAGETLFNEGDKGDAFFALITGPVSIVEGPVRYDLPLQRLPVPSICSFASLEPYSCAQTESTPHHLPRTSRHQTSEIAQRNGQVEVVRLHPPATLGERALEEETGARTATVIAVDSGVLARLDAETYRRCVVSEKVLRLQHMEDMEKEQAAMQLQARQRGRAQRKKLEERLQAKKEGKAWRGKKTELQQNGLDEAVLASGAVKVRGIAQMTEEKAAIKIQAHIRGRQHRRKLKTMQDSHEAEIAEAKLKHEQKLKREKSRLEGRLAKKKGSSLALNPENPAGKAIVLELLGGKDKQKKGPAQGHRRDTFPLCNALIEKGWSCNPVLYSDDEYNAVASACADADVVIVRASDGLHEGVTVSKLDNMLQELVASGKAVLPAPATVTRLGAKDCVVKLGDLPCGMSGTLVYHNVASMRAQLPKSLAGGARVLKANRGKQGSAVWLCTLVSQDSGGEITVQHALDNSVETMTMDALLTKLEQEGFSAAIPESEQGYGSEASAERCIVDQMFFPEVSTVGELRATMVGDTLCEVQKRMPRRRGFSATFKAGATFTKCSPDDEDWARAQSSLSTDVVAKMPAAVGCASLPLIWSAELLPCAGSGCVVGEIDCGCIGVATSDHLLPTLAEAAIAMANSTAK